MDKKYRKLKCTICGYEQASTALKARCTHCGSVRMNEIEQFTTARVEQKRGEDMAKKQVKEKAPEPEQEPEIESEDDDDLEDNDADEVDKDIWGA